MADTKISALTAATTPLAGTEVLPIVQSGVTKQVSVANLTAGRAISTTGINDANGNEIFKFTTIASAVNELTVANATTGSNPTITPSGGDSNIGLDLQMKGTGATRILSGSSSTALNTLNNLRIQSSNGLADPAGDVYITASIDSATAGDRGTAMILKTGRTGGVVTNMSLWSTGGVSIGNSTDPGANNLSVTGRTSSQTGSNTIGNGVTQTLFSLGTGDVYIVNCSFANFSGGTTTAIVWLPQSGNTSYSGIGKLGENFSTFTLSVSGANVQITNNVGASVTYYWSAIKLY